MCGLNFFQMTVRQCTYHIYVPGTIYYIVCGFVKILCIVCRACEIHVWCTSTCTQIKSQKYAK